MAGRRGAGRGAMAWIGALGAAALSARAEPLGPAHVLVVASGNVPASRELAAYYVRARGIPEGRVVLLDAPDRPVISRAAFEDRVRAPIERAIVERGLKEKIRALAVLYGMPMRVEAPRVEPPRELEGEARRRWIEERRHGRMRAGAAVDSELALLFRPRPPEALPGFERNPAFGREDLDDLRRVGITLVSRIDGPTPEIARRLIDDAIAAERDGLAGKGCFDARQPTFGKGPAGYDVGDWFVRCAYLHARNAGFEAILDERPALLGRRACPDCALYYGWYRLAGFRDHFGRLARGAIAIHIASAEGWIKFGRGKGPGSPLEGGPWCLGLLRVGAAVTAGPVAEPYLAAFPQGFVFFREIFCGRAVCEAYWLSIPWVSWQMQCIGDPLYAPFRRHPRRGFVFLRGALLPGAAEPNPLPTLPAGAGRPVPVALLLERPAGTFRRPFRLEFVRATPGLEVRMEAPSFRVFGAGRKLEVKGTSVRVDPRRARPPCFAAVDFGFTAAGDGGRKIIELLLAVPESGPPGPAAPGVEGPDAAGPKAPDR